MATAKQRQEAFDYLSDKEIAAFEKLENAAGWLDIKNALIDFLVLYIAAVEDDTT